MRVSGGLGGKAVCKMYEGRIYEGSGDLAVKERMKVRLYLRAVAKSSHENSMRRNDAPSSLASDTTSHGRAGLDPTSPDTQP